MYSILLLSTNIKIDVLYSQIKNQMEYSKYKFLWGVATSSYQVEGGISNNDWDYFTRSDPIKRRISSLTQPSIFYKGRTQIHLQSAGEAVKFWKPEYYENDQISFYESVRIP